MAGLLAKKPARMTRHAQKRPFAIMPATATHFKSEEPHGTMGRLHELENLHQLDASAIPHMTSHGRHRAADAAYAIAMAERLPRLAASSPRLRD